LPSVVVLTGAPVKKGEALSSAASEIRFQTSNLRNE
jgi:hypothetical protein